ncbi:MAG TPA: outer membrane beta-barrel protein, partial [Candidatus Saccharicenans sp.]|nr:outer membrane beta-barrel protein [Candidatus Saccharicenans sp.]
NLPLRAGYYIWKGLEIEPELMLTKAEGADAGFILAANLAYNFNLKGNLRPFILAGIGFGNGFTVANIAEGDSDVNATVVNLGLGVKYLIGNSAALRLEYRYTHNHMKYDYVIEAITIQQAESGTENVNSHQILAGVSIFF